MLRAPGTINCKPQYGPDFPTVRFIRADLKCTYIVEERSVVPLEP